MKLKTSFCNATIFKKDITRLAPMWVLELLIIFLGGVAPVLSGLGNILEDVYEFVYGDEAVAESVRECILDGGDVLTLPPMIAVFCFMVTLNVFGYLTRERECYTMHSFPVEILTPVAFFWGHTGGRVSGSFAAGVASVTYDSTMEYLWKDSMYLIPAVILLLVVMVLYEKRPLECAGDLVAFSWGRPVFRIVFSFCGSMLFATAVYYIYIDDNIGTYAYASIFKIMLFLVGTGAMLCYLIANMAIYNTFFIWKKTSYLRMVLLALCMMAGVVATRNYSFGAGLPDKSNLADAEMEYWDYSDGESDSKYINLILNKKQDILEVYKINRQIISYGKTMNITSEGPDMNYVCITYTLQNGNTWTSTYGIERDSSMDETVKEKAEKMNHKTQ